MIERQQVITSAIERVVGIARGRERGEMLFWHEIENAAGFERGTRHWGGFIQRLKKTLLKELGVAVWAVHGQGFQLLTVEDHVFLRDKLRTKKMISQANKNLYEHQHLPDSGLPDHVRAAKHAAIDRTERWRSEAHLSIRHHEYLSKPRSSGIPRPEPM